MVTPLVPVETSMRGKDREGYNHVAKSAKIVASCHHTVSELGKGKSYYRITRNMYMMTK